MPTNGDTCGDSDAPESPPEPTLPPPVKRNEDSKSRHNTGSSSNVQKPKKEPQHWTRYLEAFCALALVLITFYYTRAAFRQAKASETAANAALSAAQTADATLKHTTANDKATGEASLSAFKQELRAYISTTIASASAAPVLVDPKGGKHYCVDVHFVNGGKTPAVGTWVTRKVTFGPNPKQVIEGLKIPIFPTSIGNMDGPGSDQWVTGCTERIDDEIVAKLEQVKTDTYLYGAIQYRDIFGDAHETGFCWVRHVGFTPFMGCEYGNWFDHRPVNEGK
jgi:hypothetical protein